MPRPLAWRTIESIAWSASEMPASCRFSEVVGAVHQQHDVGLVRGQHRAEAPEVVLREVPGGAFVHHRDRLIRVASAQHRQQLRRVRAWLVDHQQRRRGEIVPAVRLSPNATNFVPTSCGAAETLTPNVQLALWPSGVGRRARHRGGAERERAAGRRRAGRADGGFTALPDRRVEGHRRLTRRCARVPARARGT